MNFCTTYSLLTFPLTEDVLCRFVAFLVGEGLSYSSIRQYLAELCHHQILSGGGDPALSSFVRLHYVLHGAHRSLPSSVRPRRLPITPDILCTLHSYWSSYAQDADAVCLWAACCVAFFAFLRVGEFTCHSWSSFTPSVLSLADVAIDSRSDPSIVFLTLRQSKTDMFGMGITVYLGHTGDVLCPVSVLLAYLAIRPPTPGPLFLLKSGDPLSRTILVAAVRQALVSKKVDISLFNGHSFRIGAAMAASQAGLSDSTIMQLGRWKSSAFIRYIRPPVRSIAALSNSLVDS